MSRFKIRSRLNNRLNSTKLKVFENTKYVVGNSSSLIEVNKKYCIMIITQYFSSHPENIFIFFFNSNLHQQVTIFLYLNPLN